jgi:hypothetical protein
VRILQFNQRLEHGSFLDWRSQLSRDQPSEFAGIGQTVAVLPNGCRQPVEAVCPHLMRVVQDYLVFELGR